LCFRRERGDRVNTRKPKEMRVRRRRGRSERSERVWQ
jgi:hypothetical protein